MYVNQDEKGGQKTSLIYSSSDRYANIFNFLSENTNQSGVWTDLIDGLGQYEETIRIGDCQIYCVSADQYIVHLCTDVINTPASCRLFVYLLFMTIKDHYDFATGEYMVTVKIMDIPMKLQSDDFFTSKMQMVFNKM